MAPDGSTLTRSVCGSQGGGWGGKGGEQTVGPPSTSAKAAASQQQVALTLRTARGGPPAGRHRATAPSQNSGPQPLSGSRLHEAEDHVPSIRLEALLVLAICVGVALARVVPLPPAPTRAPLLLAILLLLLPLSARLLKVLLLPGPALPVLLHAVLSTAAASAAAPTAVAALATRPAAPLLAVPGFLLLPLFADQVIQAHAQTHRLRHGGTSC